MQREHLKVGGPVGAKALPFGAKDREWEVGRGIPLPSQIVS